MRISPPKILTVGLASVIVAGTILLSLPIATETGQRLPFTQALFTATSATAVTGLIISNTSNTFSAFGEAVILILIQVGGLGLMVFSTLVAVVLGRKISLRERLLIKESFNEEGAGGAVRLAIGIIKFTLIIEGVGALLLALIWTPRFGFPRAAYLGIFHSISAFCNAGFDLFANSLTEFRGSILVNVVVVSLLVIGGLGFSVNLELYAKRSWSRLSLHSKLVLATTLTLALIGFFGFLAMENTNPATLAFLSPKDKVLGCFFQALTPRTAGFSTIPPAGFRNSTLLLMMALMFIGASPGSTGGGIKTTTAAVLGTVVVSTVTGRANIEVFNKRIMLETVLRTMVIVVVSMLLVLTAAIALLYTENLSFASVAFETVSAFGTVGLSTGATPHLTAAGRVILSFLMFAGRVGPLTLTYAVARNQQGRTGLKRPEEKISVG